MWRPLERQDLLIPVFKDFYIPFSAVPFGLAFIIFTYFVINGSSNAVNLTDGLDGNNFARSIGSIGIGCVCPCVGDAFAECCMCLILPIILK